MSRVTCYSGCCKSAKVTDSVKPVNPKDAEDTSDYTWQELAAIFDWFCFATLSLILIFTTIILFLAMKVGGTISANDKAEGAILSNDPV